MSKYAIYLGVYGTINVVGSLLIKSILEVPWVHCNGLYEMNTCSYGSFVKVVTFMRAFCNLMVKLREKVTKSRTSHGSEVFFTD